ncbi:hypothetical protein DAPK24_018210 [Pichia kluyveri]|uniref:Protein HID1 n=1 Tax=Pichia kluyveri TaxID=36015 RepID=A0AAV5R1U1_PICKL|nr:hypothetical protein DAPK24_018210 [Pichia kluyveri]
MDDIHSVFQPPDIRYLRDHHPQTLASLISSISTHLVYLSKLSNVPIHKFPKIHLLNCIRLLTLIMPFLYEKSSSALLEDKIFWSAKYHSRHHTNGNPHEQISPTESNIPTPGVDDESHNGQSPNDETSSLKVDYHTMIHSDSPLGMELINSCLDLLFTLDFTVQSNKVSASFANDYQPIVWEPGCENLSHYMDPVLDLDSNRLEIIRLLLSLFSKNLYTTHSDLVGTGSRFLTVFVAVTNGRKYYTLCLSLINTILRSTQNNSNPTISTYVNSNINNNNGLEVQNNDVHKKIRILLVTNIIQLFSIIVVYPIPFKDINFLYKYNIILSHNNQPKNRTRMFLNKLNKIDDLKFIISTLSIPILNPINDLNNLSAFSYIMKSSKLIDDDEIHIWSKELLIILLEFFQCNSKYRSVFTELLGPEFFVSLMYFVLKYKDDVSQKNFVKLCVQNLFYLSSDLRMCSKLLSHFNIQLYESLPQLLRTSTTPTSYRDFLLIHLCNILSSFNNLNEFSNNKSTDSFSSNNNNNNNNNIISNESTLISPLIHFLYNLITMHIALFEYNKRENRDILSNRRLSIKDLSKCPPSQLSYAASSSLIHVITKLSNQSYLSQNTKVNCEHISLILAGCCQAVCRDPSDSIVLLYILSKNASLLNKLAMTIKNLSDDLFNTLIQNEKKQFEIRQHQLQQQQFLQPESRSMSQNDDPLNDYYDNDNDNEVATMPTLSRQTTLESIPSIRSMPALTKQTSQISISHESPKLAPINHFRFDEGVDPQKTESEENIDIKGEYKILIPDDGFNTPLPIGMSDRKAGKNPYYGKFEDTWSGKEALHVLRECIKLTNTELLDHEKSNNKNGYISNNSKLSDSLYVIQTLLKLNIGSIINDISKSDLYNPDRLAFNLLKFKWNFSSLAWYISLIWSDIFLNYNVYESKGLLAELSSGISAIKKTSSSWGFGGWKIGSNNDENNNSPEPKFNRNEENDHYESNIMNYSIWFGTHIILFRINPTSVRNHYSLQHGKSEILNLITNNNNSNSSPFAEVLVKRNSVGSPLLNMRGNGSGVFTEGFWKRQGVRPNSLERRDSDVSLKMLLRGNGGSNRPSISQ